MTSKLKTHFKHYVIGSLIAALGAGTYAIAAVTFTDFVTATPISSTEMNTKLNALKDAVNLSPGGNLPSGNTIRGFFGLGWTAGAANEYHETFLPFIFTLASAPTAHFIASGTAPPAGCPGTSANPQADPGHLCVYEDNTGNTASKSVCSSSACPGATRWGAQYRAFSVAAGTAFTRGTWAVTAP